MMVALLENWLRNELRTKAGLSRRDIDTVVAWAGVARICNPVAFVGAGMSRNALAVKHWQELEPSRVNAPSAATWDDLAKVWRRGLQGEGADGKIADPLWLAELYEQRHGRTTLIKTIRDAIPQGLLEPGKAHRVLATIDWAGIITTNYDDLVERALKEAEFPRDAHVVCCDEELTDVTRGDNRLLILHPHGVLERPGTITITHDDYRRFPVERPGIQVKVRQLLIEHPLLVLGFSALDPNFIQWQGWLGDFIGKHQLPGLSVVVGNPPSVARQTYWGHRLRFVAVKDAVALEQLLAVVGSYLKRDHAEDLLGTLLIEQLGQARSLDGLLNALAAALRWHDHRGRLARPMDVSSIVEASIRRAVALARPNGDGSQALIQRIFSISQELANQMRSSTLADSVTNLPTMQEQREALLSAFGSAWPRWLDVVAPYSGPVIWTGGQGPRVQVVDEISALGNALDPDLKGRLFGLIHTAVLAEVTTGAGLVDATQRCYAERPDAEMTTTERAAFNDGVARARLRVGGLSGDVPAASAVSAQLLRRRGFHCVLAGTLVEASRAYVDAAKRSRDENEPEMVQRLTLETARGVCQVAGFALSGSNRSGVGMDRALLDRLKELERRDNPEYKQFDRLERELSSKVVATLESLLDDQDNWDERNSITFGSTAGSLLDGCEGMWVRPDVAGRASEALAIEQFREKNITAGIYRLSSYGSPVLKRLVRRVVRSRRSSALDEAAVTALLTHGRWPGEWLSRLEAMPAWLGELPALRLAEAEQWIEACADAVLKADVVFARPGTVAAFDMTCPGKLADAQHAIFANSHPDHVSARWLAWQKRTPHDQWHQQLLSQIAACIGQLQWRRWLDDGQVSSAEVDAVLATAAQQLGAHPLRIPVHADSFFSSIIHGLFESGGSRTILDFPQLHQELLNLAAKQEGSWFAGGHSRFQVRDLVSRALPERERATARQALAKEAIALLDAPRDFAPQTDAVHLLARVCDAVSDSEWRALLPRIARLAILSTERSDPFAKSAQGDVARCLSHLCIGLLSEGSVEFAQEARRLLHVAWSLDQTMVSFAVDLPTSAFEPLRADIVHRVSMMFAGSPGTARDSPRSLRLAACDAALRWSDTELGIGTLPGEWAHGLIFLTGSDDLRVAWSALGALRVAARNDRLDRSSAEPIRLIADALVRATRDSRSAVVGAAAAAVVDLRSYFEPGSAEHGDLEAAMESVRLDVRLAVVAAVRHPDARDAGRGAGNITKTG